MFCISRELWVLILVVHVYVHCVDVRMCACMHEHVYMCVCMGEHVFTCIWKSEDNPRFLQEPPTSFYLDIGTPWPGDHQVG